MPENDGLCQATDGAEVAPLYCDLRAGHGGERHRERFVAAWRRDGSDVRWFDKQTGRYVPDPPLTDH